MSENNNCNICEHLKYEGDSCEGVFIGGFYCDKREESDKLDKDIQEDKYRERHKVCFEARQNND